jgi:uncharacterized protein (DUF305 family)
VSSLPKTAVRRLRAATAATLLLGILGATGACGADSEQKKASGGKDEPNVIQPGKPGESAKSVEPNSVSRSDEWNHADVAFMQMMIPHHAQAVQMSKLARSRAEDRRVRILADRIRATQAPEIQAMSAWLQERKMDVPRAGADPAEYDHGQHGHNSMMGMLKPVQMKRLAAARGPEFDRLFLRGMIQHHGGAISMAQDAARDGVDIIAGEMTADVSATQSAEISRMRDLLASL